MSSNNNLLVNYRTYKNSLIDLASPAHPSISQQSPVTPNPLSLTHAPTLVHNPKPIIPTLRSAQTFSCTLSVFGFQPSARRHQILLLTMSAIIHRPALSHEAFQWRSMSVLDEQQSASVSISVSNLPSRFFQARIWL